MQAQAHDARPCPACGGSRSRPVFTVRDFLHVRCRGCDTLFVARTPTQDEVASIYLQDDYHADAASEESASRMRAEAEGRAARLEQLGCRDVLEVGCGYGYFLDAAAARGMRIEGVDRAPTAAAARERGHTVHDCWLDDLTPVSRRFDAVAAWEVLEHVPDPVRMLASIARWLRPEGVLAISTPSSSGVAARVLGQRFPMICPPDHLELFSRRGLDRALERGGFRAFDVRTFSALGPAQLRRGFQRYALGNSRPAAAVSTLLAYAALPPLGLVDRVGLGTTFEVLARPVG